MHNFFLVAMTAGFLALPVSANDNEAHVIEVGVAEVDVAEVDVIDAETITQLALTTTFAIAQDGSLARTSHGERLYRRLLRSPSGFRIFNEMLRRPLATTEARLYAACGIRHLAPAAFDEATRDLLRADSSASVLYADIVRRENVGGAAGLLARIKTLGCGEAYRLQ